MQFVPTRPLLFVAALLFLLTGCAGPLELTYEPTTVAEPVRLSTPPASVFVADFTDVRKTETPKTIGLITATISDMNATKLVLDTEPASTLRLAFIKELGASGYTVLEGPLKKANNVQYVLTGELRELSLDIGARDAVSIEAYIELRENSTGSVAWSGVLRESGDRYAGVMGNSRRTINRYLSNSIASLVHSAIAASAPAMFGAGLATQPGTIGSGEVGGSDVEVSTSPGIGPAKGSARSDSTLAVESEPSGAKVYIDNVYWGTTPLTINFYPGTYELKLKKNGYKVEKEKVGLKRGRTTEYKTELLREKSAE